MACPVARVEPVRHILVDLSDQSGHSVRFTDDCFDRDVFQNALLHPFWRGLDQRENSHLYFLGLASVLRPWESEVSAPGVGWHYYCLVIVESGLSQPHVLSLEPGYS